MPRKTKFNLLLDPDQLVALREIQTITGANIAEQIRRAIADWIAVRGALPYNRVYEGLREIAATPEPVDPAKRRMLATMKNLEKSVRKSLATKRELDAIARGERTYEETARFLAKGLKVKAARKRAESHRTKPRER